MKRFKTVDDFVAAQEKFYREITKVREILLATGLTEAVKWGFPTYMHKGKNMAGIGSFKSYFGLWFFQGGLLKDKSKKLNNAQQGKTKAMRQWRFNSMADIDAKLITAYVLESIEHFEKGNIIKPSKKKPYELPNELKKAITADLSLEAAFKRLSYSCQREYADYIGEAKRDATKQRRLEKSIIMIKENKGLNDKYK